MSNARSRFETLARELAGPVHRHGAIPHRFWREAYEMERQRLQEAVDAIERMVAEGQQLHRAEPYLGIIGVQAAKLRAALSGGSVDEEAKERA